MATEPTFPAIAMAKQLQTRERPTSKLLAACWASTKPDINFLVAITVLAGFCAARPATLESFPYLLLLHTLLGTLLVGGSAGVLNQVIELPFDAQMRRTTRRPLVAGNISPRHALGFGITLAVGGAAYLALAVNLLSCLIAALTLISYLFIYTPLKRKTPLCTFVGAIPGAASPLIGWSAARGDLSAGGWGLYLLLFLWQFPHFMAIAWMYREDYDRAGYKVLPQGTRRNRFLELQCAIPALLLIPISLLPAATHAGRIYFFGAALLSSTYAFYSLRLALLRTNPAARRLLFVSIIYLPTILLVMMLDKT